MAMIYIQQNGTLGQSIKYPSSAHPSATISSSGCGVCSSLMILLNSTSVSKTLQAWTTELRNNNCREAEGTNMINVCKLMKNSYGFTYETTTSLDKLTAHLKKGYKAVANVGARGYFSSSGHFVCVAGITNSGKYIVLDPYMYNGKFTCTCNGINRGNYFSYNSSTHEVQCAPSTLQADAQGYKYFLFTPTKNINLKYSSNDIKKNTSGSSTSKQTGSNKSFPVAVTWKNGITEEKVYMDSARNKQVGVIEKNGTGKCYGRSGTSYTVVYTLDGTSKHKAGFVAYDGKISTVPNSYKPWKNGSTKEIVYADTAKKTQVGYIEPKGSCYCLGKIDGMYLVTYKVDNSNYYKTGFVSYAGGVA